jgi:hypothetical protein
MGVNSTGSLEVDPNGTYGAKYLLPCHLEFGSTNALMESTVFHPSGVPLKRKW